MRFTLSITTNPGQTLDNANQTRSFGNINQGYVRLVGDDDPASVLPYINGTQVESFAAWADRVARGIVSLSQRNFDDANITAVFSTTEEINE